MKAGYKPCSLGSVAKVIAGQSPEGKYYNDKGEGLPFYQGKKEFGERVIGEPTTWTTDVTKIGEPGDILMSVRAPVGPVNFTDQIICIGRGLAAIRSSETIDSDFLYYQLLSKQDEIAGTEGAVFASINKAAIEALQVVVPAIEEQRRIVTLLDEAFADIATAKANAEKNLQNARELFTRISGSVLAQYASTSQSITLEDLVELDCSLSYGIVQPGDEIPEGLPIVRPVDMNTDVVMLEGLKRIDPALANSYARTTLKGNDILLCVRGTTGTVALAHSELAGANVTRGIVPIRFAPEKISHQFGYYLLRSEPAQLQIQAKTYGTALQQINIRDLRQLTLPVPAPQDQEIIVQRLSALEEETKTLTAAYENKLTALDDLKKSLLHQAFSGQL